MADEPFWESKSLDQMSEAEWESLCDGCGQCCLHKLVDEDTEQLFVTRVACQLLDRETCRCTNYQQRFELVPDCLSVRPLDDEKLGWLPATCAYRLIHEGKPLRWWHPLVSGDPKTVRAAGISIAGRCVSEGNVPDTHYMHFLLEEDVNTE